MSDPQMEPNWAATVKTLATASPEVQARVRAALAEQQDDNPRAAVVLELDSRVRQIQQVLPSLSHQQAQALLAMEGVQARMAYRELVNAVADAITAAGWQQVAPLLQGVQLVVGVPWGLNVFRAAVNQADHTDLERLWDDKLSGVVRAVELLKSAPPPPDGTDRDVAVLAGEVRTAEGPSLDDPILPGFEPTWRDLDLLLEVEAFMRQHEPLVWRAGGMRCWLRAAWIYRRCQDVERDRRPGEPRRGPFEIFRPQPKEQPKPQKPKSFLEQLGGIQEWQLAELGRQWQLRRTGMEEHKVAGIPLRRGAPL
jgi:hypothetical protein